MTDGGDPIWDDMAAFFARVERLRVRLADDGCPPASAGPADCHRRVASECEPPTVRYVWSAEAAVSERIGELLRTLH